MGFWDTVGTIADYTVPGVALRHGFGGEKFTSNNYNRSNALNQNDPALAKSEAAVAEYKKRVGGEVLGQYAQPGQTDYRLYGTRSGLNPSQSLGEEIVDLRKNYYLGGNADYANNAATNATNTGSYWASKQAALGSDAAHRGDVVFNRQYGPEGPSAAQAVLAQGTNEAIGTQLALARSGRGMGQSASAMNAAQGNAVGLQTSAANNAAILRAQEAENYAQRRDAAQRANDQAALSFGQLGQEGYGNAGQSALAGQQLANQVQTSALQGNMGYEQALINKWGMSKGYGLQQNQMDQQRQNALIAAGASYLGSVGSDRRMKRDIYKLSPIEAKKNRQLRSSGDFDALGNEPPAWMQNYMNTEGSTGSPSAGSFPAIQPEVTRPAGYDPLRPSPARNFGLLKNYREPPSDFARELGSGDASHLGQPSNNIVNPWTSGSDPWADYLARRQRKEDEDRYNQESDAAQRKGMSAAGTIIGAGALLGLLASDMRVKAHAKPRGKLAQDPLSEMPAISGRGVIMSDERSKTLSPEQQKRLAGLEAQRHHWTDTHGEDAVQRQTRRELEQWYGIEPGGTEPFKSDLPADMTPRTLLFDPYGVDRQGRTLEQRTEYQDLVRRMRNTPPGEFTEEDMRRLGELSPLSSIAPPQRSDRLAAAQQAVRAAPGYSYEYKNPSAPGAAPGTHFGPMAQDLEKTPAGRSTVVQGPGGMKMVDTGRLALVNTAALHAQQQELDSIKAQLAGAKSKQPAAPEPSRAARAAAVEKAAPHYLPMPIDWPGREPPFVKADKADQDYGLPEDQRRTATYDRMPYEGQDPYAFKLPTAWPRDMKAIVPRGYGAESGQPVWKARTNRAIRDQAAQLGLSDTRHIYPQTIRDMFPEGSAGRKMSDDQLMTLWRDAWAEPM